MIDSKRRILFTAVLLLIGVPGCSSGEKPSSSAPSDESTAGPVFSIQTTRKALTEIASLGLETPINGRLFVIISNDEESEPRNQIGVAGVPFWGMDVTGFDAETQVILSPGSDDVRGFPLENLSQLPVGQYFVQAFISVYTTFHRSDGNTLSMHLNSGAGQDQWRAPGNAYSLPVRLSIDPATTGSFSLIIDQVIPPVEPLEPGDVLQQGNPVDTDRVKFVKIRSEVLSDFWGRDMYIGANILLPSDYDQQTSRRYPTLYMQGHFPGRRAPLGFVEGETGRGRSEGFSEFWTSGDAPGMIAVSIRDANPYYDTSYSVNSANVGPYGDAIMNELIPYLEDQFRMIPSSWARILAGGSTGGWEAIAMQVFYPDAFGGSWGWCPDPLDFNYYQIVNVYDDDNAYTTGNAWHSVERPNARRPDGNIRSTVRQENYLELATGSRSRSGGQWAIWEAVFGPVGDDGYPRPIWDPVTGEIDHDTADYWRDNYDMVQYLKRNWETAAPRLDGKLHIAVGDMDSYYLDNSVYLMQEFLESATGPHIESSFEYGRREPHCWTGYSPNQPGENLSNIEFVKQVAAYIKANAPVSADLLWLD